MNREKTLDSIPIDLFLEIFSRLPTKSVGRCRCVSKQWASILVRQDFTELFLTRSSTRPRLLFALERFNGDWLFFSSSQHRNPYEKSSLVVDADFHTKFPRSESNCIYASGLFYFPDMQFSKKKGEEPVPVICNPLTGQYTILPKLRTDKARNFLGFDPIDKQYKVLVINNRVNNVCGHHILTLGTGKKRWRNIQCSLTHVPWCEGICINGVLYYVAKPDDTSYMIVCFDVRSEEFKFIKTGRFYCRLINYKGKLGGIEVKRDYDIGDDYHGILPFTYSMWVLEDPEKHESSKSVYHFPKVEARNHLFIVGSTARGEIVFTENHTSTYKPVSVLYLNPEKNTLQSFQIKGSRDFSETSGRVLSFVDHVEDLNDTKQLKSSIYESYDQDRPRFESINKYGALCLLDDE